MAHPDDRTVRERHPKYYEHFSCTYKSPGSHRLIFYRVHGSVLVEVRDTVGRRA
jgi:hypothetical protein